MVKAVEHQPRMAHETLHQDGHAPGRLRRGGSGMQTARAAAALGRGARRASGGDRRARHRPQAPASAGRVTDEAYVDVVHTWPADTSPASSGRSAPTSPPGGSSTTSGRMSGTSRACGPTSGAAEGRCLRAVRGQRCDDRGEVHASTGSRTSTSHGIGLSSECGRAILSRGDDDRRHRERRVHTRHGINVRGIHSAGGARDRGGDLHPRCRRGTGRPPPPVRHQDRCRRGGDPCRPGRHEDIGGRTNRP